jgi:hypothetical protein
MIVGSNGRRMITVFPKGPFALFPLVELLCDSPGNQLHTFGNLFVPSIFHQKVDVIGGSHVIQNTESVSSFGLEQPSAPGPAIKGEFKEKVLLVTSMRDMPYMTRQKISIGSWQVRSPYFPFRGQNGCSKRKTRAYFSKFLL